MNEEIEDLKLVHVMKNNVASPEFGKNMKSLMMLKE